MMMRLVPGGHGRQDARLEAFALAGDTRAEAWVRALLQDELPAQAYGRAALLAPGAKPPATLAPRSRQVCTCLNVTEGEIPRHPGAMPGQRRRPPGPSAGRTALRHPVRLLRARTAPAGAHQPAGRVTMGPLPGSDTRRTTS